MVSCVCLSWLNLVVAYGGLGGSGAQAWEGLDEAYARRSIHPIGGFEVMEAWWYGGEHGWDGGLKRAVLLCCG